MITEGASAGQGWGSPLGDWLPQYIMTNFTKMKEYLLVPFSLDLCPR